ncbi:MAG: glycogen(starch) synthase [Gammaproteobacteria bacterium]|jgi:glycogen(starch) synthase
MSCSHWQVRQPLLEDIVSRGTDSENFFKIPNGVDASRFLPQGKDDDLLDKYGLRNCTVLGFIGTFFDIEGLDCLVRAMQKIAERLRSVRLLLVGGGEEEHAIQRLSTELGLSDKVIFPGRVAHAAILKYYSIMDVLIYPRIRNRVTDLVTPLKP